MANTNTSTIVGNLVVLSGVINAAPDIRDLGGDIAWQFDVLTVVADERGERRIAVPVNWVGPSATESSVLVEGADVMVVGTVRRRFFRAGGHTQSRTEVVPDRVVPLRRRATVRSVLAATASRLA